MKTYCQNSFQNALMVRIIATLFMTFVTVGNSMAQTPASGLLSFANIKRLGAFRLPNIENTNYARGVIEINPDNNSFYMVGHDQRNLIAEFSIPSTLSNSTNLNDLATAKLMQGFQNVMQRAAGGNTEVIEKVGGLKLITDSQGKKKLIGAGYEYYDTSGQTYTHFVVNNPANLASTSVKGYFAIAGPARKQSGYMVELPPKWQKIFGKTHIIGQSSGMPIISGLSVGPAAYAVNLAEIGNQLNPKTVTLLEYDLSHTLNPGGEADLYNESGANKIWTHLSRAAGVFISGDTIGFLGYSGGHNDGVGYKSSIKNPCAGEGGFGANNCDYDYHYWFYDLNDLKKVMEGKLLPYGVQPYEQGPFMLPWGNGSSGVGGVATDPKTGYVYLTQLSADRKAVYSSLPIVHVFDVSIGVPRIRR